jgi:glycyl-tRNA synthetase beta chain
MSRLLLEVGTEAIPAGYLPPALAALEERTRNELAAARLPGAQVRALATAKRLVLEADDLPARQEDVIREVQGPRVEVAFKDGKPTPAAMGFARKSGLAVEALERASSEKGEFVVARVHERGRETGDVLPALLSRLIEGLEWPKTMVWNSSRFRFPRPVRWVVCLLDDTVLPIQVAGISADRQTRGHRLLGPGSRPVAEAGALDAVLAEAGVILDPKERRRMIEAGLEEEARRLGGRWVPDPDLVDEVVHLCEHPWVGSGRFDREFLELPREVVITAMRSHQRYFAVEDEEGRLLAHFLVVCDGEWKEAASVLTGNERVLRARLADAKFYWDVDLRDGMEKLAEALGSVVWLETAGTLREKTERVARLVDRVGEVWFPDEWKGLRDDVVRAARWAKADLASEMIKDGKEFTGLQGMIGARYAEAEGASRVLVEALSEQYLPRGARDPLPESPGGTVLAFVDRLDTVAGCFGAGFVPSGSQDPYGLRRAANGMVRILLEKELHLSLGPVVSEAAEQLPEKIRRKGLTAEILDFLRERQAFQLRERGLPYDVVDAVLTADAEDPLDALARARALEAIRDQEALERVVIGFKRAANILKGIEESALPDPQDVDWSRTEKAERELHRSVREVEGALGKARGKKDYPAMLEHLLALRGPIDIFFDEVLVMSENREERDRRLALLAEARGLFRHFFDPARIVIEGE